MIDESTIGRFIQPAKIYHGWREKGLTLMMQGIFSSDNYPFVTVNGQPLRAFNFGGADFFEWGYDGTGPRMLALAILADYFGETPTINDYRSDQEMARSRLKCVRYCQRFLHIIATLDPASSWTISSDHLREWLQSLERN